MKYKLLLFFLFSQVLFANSLALFFEGNVQIKKRELYEVLALHKPYLYEFWKKEPVANPKTVPLLSQSIKEFYKSRGFFHVVVTHQISDAHITIIIKENTPIIVANISVVSEYDISDNIPFSQGAVFDAQKFNQSKKDIKFFYLNKGYCNAKIEAKTWIDIETNFAYLYYETMPEELCYFGEITITPPPNIDAEILKSFLYTQEKELYSLQRITQSYKSLYAQEGIAKAIIDTNEVNGSSVNLQISVDEVQKPIRFLVGAGASSDEGLMGKMGVKHSNLFGNLKTLSLSTRVTQIKQTIKASANMPLVDKNSICSEIGFENENFIGYSERGLFANLLLKQRGLKHTFEEGIVFDYSNTYDSEDQLLFAEGSLFIPSLTLEWGMDTRDKLLEPSRGYFVRANIMGSIESKISDASYYKFNLNGGYIFPLEKSIVAIKAKFGSLNLLSGEIPASYRYYTGGMYSNRAYAYRKLGPTNAAGDPTGSDTVFETTLEYRFPIYNNIRGVAFNDNTVIDNNYLPGFDKIYSSLGLGIRYQTPIGPLAIDFGFDIDNPKEEYAFHFHIGELF